MALERTLSIIKPDAVEKNVIGKVLSRFEDAGLKISAMRLALLSKDDAAGFMRFTRIARFLMTWLNS